MIGCKWENMLVLDYLVFGNIKCDTMKHATNFPSMELSVKQIAKATGLSVEKLNSIKLNK